MPKKAKSRPRKKSAEELSLQKLTKLSDAETAKQFQEFAHPAKQKKFVMAWEARGNNPDEALPPINKTDDRRLQQAIKSAISTSPHLIPEQLGNWLIKSEKWSPNAAAEVSKRFYFEKMQSLTQRQLEEAKTRLMVEIKALFRACPDVETLRREEYEVLGNITFRTDHQEILFRELQRNLEHINGLITLKAKAGALQVDFRTLVQRAKRQLGLSEEPGVPQEGRQGRIPDQKIEERREIVRTHIHGKSDFFDSKIAARLQAALEAAEIPAPRDREGDPAFTRLWTGLRPISEAWIRVVEVLNRDRWER